MTMRPKWLYNEPRNLIRASQNQFKLVLDYLNCIFAFPIFFGRCFFVISFRFSLFLRSYSCLRSVGDVRTVVFISKCG